MAATTTYGTIPTSSPGGSNLEYLSRVKERLASGLGDRRPWKEMFNFRSINLPATFNDALGRIRTNVAYFRMNYAIVVLLIIFLSLLWHPISMIVFVVMMAAWVFLYFLRDEPLVVFHRTINDRVVLIVLSVLTLVFLFLTNATVNLLVSLLIAAVVVLVHAALRKTDDLFLDEEAAEAGGLLAGGGGVASSSSST
ncbi:PRA1 family protein F2-like [Cornus florida]|uniref:PRA1 family protein F2-like n=1 Tax=Cornus florida TaxID=4283 RepID=UPI00289B364C|nr:PRA1 family protein F2-like [Cornus florida]